MTTQADPKPMEQKPFLSDESVDRLKQGRTEIGIGMMQARELYEPELSRIRGLLEEAERVIQGTEAYLTGEFYKTSSTSRQYIIKGRLFPLRAFLSKLRK